MTTDRLREFWLAEPFEPFRLNLADGRSIEVRHRELLSHAQNRRTFTVEQGNGSINIIDLLLVVDLELMPPQTDNA